MELTITFGGQPLTLELGESAARAEAAANSAEADAAAALSDRLLGGASAITAAASATVSVAAATTAQNERQAIEAALAGGQVEGVPGQPVASRALMAADAAPATTNIVYCYEAWKHGVFLWSGADLSAQVALDPLQGIYVPPASDATGASGAWVRQAEKVLHPEFWASSGSTDDTAALRDALYWACTLGLPIEPLFSSSAFWLTEIVYVGSRTTSAPSAGFINHLNMRERWRFICNAPGEDALISFENGEAGIRVGDMDFDILTASPADGHGACRLVATSDFVGGTFTKIGDSGSVPATSGGSVLSISGECIGVRADAAIVEWAGGLASGVFASFTTPDAGVTKFNPKNIHVDFVKCVGGQDCVDWSGVDHWYIGEAYGEDLTHEDSSIIDCGNSSNGWCGTVRGDTVTHGVTMKTEESGGAHGGSNNNRFASVNVTDYSKALVRMSAGATTGTTEQTLHKNTFGEVSGATVVADADTVALQLVAGDDTADPTRGFVVEGGVVSQNAGKPIHFQGEMNAPRISNWTCDAPDAIEDDTPGGAAATNALLENVNLVADWGTTQAGVRIENSNWPAKLTFANGHGLRLLDSEFKALDLSFSGSQENRDVLIRGVELKNSVGRALRILGSFTGTDPIEQVRLINVRATDDQGSPTSTGFEFGQGVFDRCVMQGCEAIGLADNDSWGFTGLHSHNTNNRLRAPMETIIGNDRETMLHATRTTKETDSGATATLPSDATLPIPLNTKVRLWAQGGASSFAAGSGATLEGSGSVASGAVGEVEKITTDTWLRNF